MENTQAAGIKLGMIAVLHTWGQNLHFHPHIHLIVTAGGMTQQGQWKPTGENYFLPVRALSSIYPQLDKGGGAAY